MGEMTKGRKKKKGTREKEKKRDATESVFFRRRKCGEDDERGEKETARPRNVGLHMTETEVPRGGRTRNGVWVSLISLIHTPASTRTPSGGMRAL